MKRYAYRSLLFCLVSFLVLGCSAATENGDAISTPSAVEPTAERGLDVHVESEAKGAEVDVDAGPVSVDVGDEGVSVKIGD